MRDAQTSARLARRNCLLTAIRYGERRRSPTARKPIFLLHFKVASEALFLCARATSLALGCSRDLVYSLITTSGVNPDMMTAPSDLPRLRPKTTTYNALTAWLSSYLSVIAEPIPEGGPAGALRLPSKVTVVEMYNLYTSKVPPPHLSLSTMYRALAFHWPNLQFPHSTQLGKCDTCFSLRSVRDSAGRDMEERLQAARQLADHWQLVEVEREEYAKRCAEAAEPQARILSLAADGASALCFPWMKNQPKCYSMGVRIPLYGTTCHTFQNQPTFFLSPPFYSHDPNYVITVLSYQIVTICRKQNFTPRILSLQLDNCWRENKNKYVLFLLSILLLKGWFDKCQVCMLPVGHTHNDIDAMFGRLAAGRYTSHREYCTPIDMIASYADPTKHQSGKPLFASDACILAVCGTGRHGCVRQTP